jgi:hypothetical protein
VVHGPFDLLVGPHFIRRGAVGADDAHHADGSALVIKDWQLMRDEPIWNALAVEEQLDDSQFGLSSTQNFLVIAAKIFSQARWEQREVILAKNFLLTLKAEAFNEVQVGGHQPELSVFGKERDAGQVVKQQVKLTVESDPSKESMTLLEQIGHARGVHWGLIDCKLRCPILLKNHKRKSRSGARGGISTAREGNEAPIGIPFS